jgi:hypothetical protein
MARADYWSDGEIALTVADYMKMLTLELAGQDYNKSAHRRELLEQLQNRSNGAVELKHQNISAVLRDLNCFWIPGYKPRGNYQKALAIHVEEWINSHPTFDRASKIAAEQPAFTPTEVNFSRMMVEAPTTYKEVREQPSDYIIARSPSKRDYLAQEARNSELGEAGEQLVMQYEEFRLRSAGKRSLAERIEHVSNSRGDGLGYDILSFEANGKERFIEVKTTSFAKETPFYASRNEVTFSEEALDQFRLYRLFQFRKQPKLFSLQGAIGEHCRLDPINFICHLR